MCVQWWLDDTKWWMGKLLLATVLRLLLSTSKLESSVTGSPANSIIKRARASISPKLTFMVVTTHLRTWDLYLASRMVADRPQWG